MEGKQKGYKDMDLIVFSEKRAKEIAPFAKELRKIKKGGKIEIVAEYKTEKFSPKIIGREVERCLKNNIELDHLFAPISGIPVLNPKNGFRVQEKIRKTLI